MRLFGIQKTRTTPLHPQSDGMVERFNRTILDYLAKFIDDRQSNWDSCLPLMLLSYRSAVHDSTKQTPAMLMLGRELRLPSGLACGYPPSEKFDTDAYVDRLKEQLQRVHEHNRLALHHASRRAKTRYDLQTNTNPLSAGDRVWLYAPKRRVGRCPKLQNDWEGPYEIVEVMNEVLYRIRRSGKVKIQTIHRDRLTPYEDLDKDSLAEA